MQARGSLAILSLLVATTGACLAPPVEEGALDDATSEDEPLDLSVDSLDIVHGALRIEATMVDGAADVSVRLGGDCERREVGGGVSTLSTLVWALGDNDVAAAIGCGLVVRARVRDGERYLNKVAELDVTPDIIAPESNDAAPQLQALTAALTGVSLVFAPLTRSARLTTGESVLAAMETESEDEDPAPEDGTGHFTVPRIDFARSVLRGRPFYLDGSAFATSLSVGGTSLEGAPGESAPGEDEPSDEPSDPP